MFRLHCLAVFGGLVINSGICLSGQFTHPFAGKRFTLSADTLICDDSSRNMIAKYTDSLIKTEDGNKTINTGYKSRFATIIHRLDTSQEVFYVLYLPEEKEGSFNYCNDSLKIIINKPGPICGTKDGYSAILFEELKHADQFLDGKTFFQKIKDKWETINNLQVEVEAKLFAANTLDIILYFPSEGTLNRTDSVTTILWHMKYNLKNEQQRCDFLKNGGRVPVYVVGGNGTATAHMNGFYPNGKTDTIINPCTDHYRIKNKTLFCYPRVPLVTD